MPQRKAITSTATGLSPKSIFLPYSENIVFVRAPDWSSSKTAQVWSSFEDIAASFAPELKEPSDSDPISITSNRSLTVEGPCYVKLHLASPGTGASLVFNDHYAPNDNDQGEWILGLNVWNDYGVWLDSSTWSES